MAGDGRWESDVVLADGSTVHLRPRRADDGDALAAFYADVSSETRYLRFLSPVSPRAAVRLEHFAEPDDDLRFVLVAELGDRIVAVSRFERISEDEAEVAFVVHDSQQGRGLGTLMLEHLAVIARTRGIRRFVAHTLDANRRMLRLFADAGFGITRSLEHGVVEVALDLTPTAATTSAQLAREHVAEARSMARLLAPSSVAVIGASRRRASIGHAVFENLLAGDFAGIVYPVNPNATSVAGVRAYASVLDIPDDVDLAVIVVPADLVPSVVAQCAQKRVHGLVVISAGFGEQPGGQQRERELTAFTLRNGMRMIGPNCMGILNTDPLVRMNATFAPTVPPNGRIAFASQSGGLGIALLARARELDLGISQFVSLGNKADVSSNDLLQFWEDDPGTDVILLYLESFGNPRKFARLAQRIGRRKPIVAVKGGRTPAGARGTASHTAALASPEVAVDALFRQAGVIRVDTLEELFDTATVLVHQPLPAGRRIAVVSNGGGPAILAADACAAAGLDIVQLSPTLQQRLRSIAPRGAAVNNPVDLLAAAMPETFERVIHTLLTSGEVDGLLVIFVAPLVTSPTEVAEAIVRGAAAAPGTAPVLACFLGPAAPVTRLDAPGGVTIPAFPFPETAARALARVAEYAEWRRRPTVLPLQLDGVDVARGRALLAEFLASHPEGGWLDAPRGLELVACFGIPVAVWRPASTAAEAVTAAEELGFPVALKAAAGDLVHKADVGGVRVGLATADAVDAAFHAMADQLGDRMRGVVVQKMADPGVETIVGVTQDPLFGPLVLFGMGGLHAELLRDTAVRLAPITAADAHELVRGLRTSPLLFGYRTTPAVDVAALEDVVARVGLLAESLAEVVELDCNPVIASPSGATAVDVKVHVAPRTPSAPADLRRLT